MSSFLKIRLDTTPPEGEMKLPSYVGYGYNPIEIHANDELDQKHDAWIIDSSGFRKDLTFYVAGDTVYGNLDVASLSTGMATLYIRLYDLGWNRSSLLSQAFEVLDTLENSLEIKVDHRMIETSFGKRKIRIETKDMEIEESFEDGKITSEFKDMPIDMELRKE